MLDVGMSQNDCVHYTRGHKEHTMNSARKVQSLRNAAVSLKAKTRWLRKLFKEVDHALCANEVHRICWLDDEFPGSTGSKVWILGWDRIDARAHVEVTLVRPSSKGHGNYANPWAGPALQLSKAPLAVQLWAAELLPKLFSRLARKLDRHRYKIEPARAALQAAIER
jgi:hypothetical protein